MKQHPLSGTCITKDSANIPSHEIKMRLLIDHWTETAALTNQNKNVPFIDGALVLTSCTAYRT